MDKISNTDKTNNWWYNNTCNVGTQTQSIKLSRNEYRHFIKTSKLFITPSMYANLQKKMITQRVKKSS